jgi:hypothetical protein
VGSGSAMSHPPFFASDEEADRAYIACDRLALNWGPVELQIEGLLVLMRNRVREWPPFPVSFSVKTSELKDRMKADARLADFVLRIHPLLVEAAELHAFRTKVVHAFCQGTNLNGELMFGRSDQKRGVAYTESRFPIRTVEKKADTLESLYQRLAPFYDELRMLPR